MQRRSFMFSTMLGLSAALALGLAVPSSPALAQSKGKKIVYIAPDHQLAFWRYLAKGARVPVDSTAR